MISRANKHSDGGVLAAYLLNAKSELGERARIFDLKGFACDDLTPQNVMTQFLGVEALKAGTKCEKAFLHCSVRIGHEERLTDVQWRQVIERLGKRVGLDGYAYGAFFHEKENGERHLHIAWNRIDAERMKAKDLPFFADRLLHESRAMEQDFGLKRLRYRKERGEERAPELWQEQQAQRTDKDRRETWAAIRTCYERSDNGNTLAAALEDAGFVLAQGKRRDFVVIDNAGGAHVLGKKTVGATAAAVRAKLADLDRASMITDVEARALLGLEREAEQVKAPKKAKAARGVEAEPRPRAPQREPDREAAASARPPETTLPPSRAQAFAAAICAEPAAFFTAMHEHRATVAYDGETFYAVTSHEAVELTKEQGQRALSAINARQDEQALLQQSRLRMLDPYRALPSMPKRQQAHDLPDIEEAKRRAYGLEKRAERRERVRALFEEHRGQRDDGKTFFEALKREGMTLRPDYAGRLHVDEKGYVAPLSESVPYDQHRSVLGGLADDIKKLRFRSAADREDSFARIVAKVTARRAIRERDAAVRAAVRAVRRPLNAAADKTKTAAKATARVTGAAARVVEKGVQAVSSVFEDLGKFEQREQEAKGERVPKPRPTARASRKEPDNATPITQLEIEESRHTPPQSADYAERIRRHAEEIRRRMEEREQERARDEGRDRWRR